MWWTRSFFFKGGRREEKKDLASPKPNAWLYLKHKIHSFDCINDTPPPAFSPSFQERNKFVRSHMTASPIFCSSDFPAQKIRKILSSTGCVLLSSQVSGLVTFSLAVKCKGCMQSYALSIQSRIWKCTPLLGLLWALAQLVRVVTGLCAGQPKALVPIWLLKTVSKTFASGDKPCML